MPHLISSHPIVFGTRLDERDELIGAKNLRLSEPCDLPSNAPMSSDVNLSNDDMKVECVLDRFGQKRVANKSSDPVSSRIA